MSQPPFSWRVRVYWEDTDAGGVVYHANYVRFLERARTEWLRQRGIVQSTLAAERGVLFVIYGMQLRFLKPARLDDELVVSVAVGHLRRASLVFEQSIRDGSGEELCRATVDAACVRADGMRPCPIPEELREEMLH
ncbi:MAG: tol-pal system-associated acyl-CoA thioesterase [Hydrogenophaga sp.]|nr:tol-pal system-associated acyl-CoA thioesterase [Xanthomonadales bacterium]MCB1628511.1 tol-pal system-associated acyl-CoA thioesterase [Xanthomonadales bacterium]MCB2017213.1 tol-pal system-associated acyl-CoA thioesterase [Hydrogenophaga sp.]